MAYISPWEEKAREHAEELARQVNGAVDYALLVHAKAPEEDRENLAPLRLDESNWWRSLVPAARKHIEVAHAITRAIRADEDEDEKMLSEAMKGLSGFIRGMSVRLSWIRSIEDYRLSQEIMGEEEDHPFVTAALALGFAEYWQQHRDLIHLGVCRQCFRVYVKPKHAVLLQCVPPESIPAAAEGVDGCSETQSPFCLPTFVTMLVITS